MNAYNSHTHTHTHTKTQKRIFLSKIHLMKKGLRCSIPFIAHTFGACVLCECVYTYVVRMNGMNVNVCIQFVSPVHTLMMPALHFHFRLISLPIHCSTRFHQKIYSSNGIWINYSDWWVVCVLLWLVLLLLSLLLFNFLPICCSIKCFVCVCAL